MNFQGKLNLKSLPGCEYLNIRGQKCIVIPVEENPTIYVGQKGIYLNIAAIEAKDNQYGNSHTVFASITDKNLRASLSEEERRRVAPILGNLQPQMSQASPSAPQPAATVDISQIAEIGDGFDGVGDLPL